MTDSPHPPTPAERDHRHLAHGDERYDPFAWMADRNDAEVLDHLLAENDHTEARLAPVSGLRTRLFEEQRARVREDDESAPARHGPWWYLHRTEEGAEHPIFLRRTGESGGDEQLVLDQNALAAGHQHTEVGDLLVSPDHHLLAYTVDHQGDERFTLRFRDIASGEDLADAVDLVAFGLAWSADSSTIFYTSPDESMRPWQVWRHRLGDEPYLDQLVHQEDDERFHLACWPSRNGRWIVISADSRTSSEVRLVDADQPTGPARVVSPRREGIEYAVEPTDDRLLVLTNDGAPGFRVVSTSCREPDLEWAEELIAPDPELRWEDIEAITGHVVVHGRRHGLPVVLVVDLATGSRRELDFGEPVLEVSPGANLEHDTDEYLLTYSSPITPVTTLAEKLSTGERRVVKQLEVRGSYDPADYETARLWAPSTGGAEVPVTLVRRRDAPAPAPTLVEVYGAYEVSYPVSFRHHRLSLLDRGMTVAIAHVRGGGELGRHWWEQGRLEHKHHTFDDTVAAVEHLVAEGVADPDRIALWGGSAGGLTVGATINARPDLVSAVVAAVPFVDVITTMSDESLPLTVIEWEEWGNPADPEQYGWMRAYSPYDNIVPEARYPAVLATGGLNDPRVGYWEPAKWIARLRRDAQGGPFLLHTELGAGHGGPSGRYQEWRETAMLQAFILGHLGLAAVEPSP